MLFRIILLFMLVPAIELALLVYVSMQISFWPTLAILLITGILGGALAKYQGLLAWRRIQTTLGSGQLPGAELVDALLILVAGVLLLTPGFLTDITGFLLLAPPVRAMVRRFLAKRFKAQVSSQSMHFSAMGGAGMPPGSGMPPPGFQGQSSGGQGRLFEDAIDVQAETVEASDDEDTRS